VRRNNNKPQPWSPTLYKNNSKWIKDLNVTSGYKIFRKKHRRKSSESELGKEFLEWTPKV
jgi:hypothetical protein